MKNYTYIIGVCALLGLACATTLAGDVAVQSHPSHTPAPSPGLCLNAPAESSLYDLETRTLGAAHAAAPEQVGQWSEPYPLPLVDLHAVLLPTGKVLFFTYKNYAANFGATAYVWDPLTRTGHTVDPPDNVWCGGQTLLANGTVLTIGGTLAYPTTTSYFKGLNQVYTFNPFNETWTRQPDMRQGRWYPTVTELADGRTLIMSGINENGQRTKNTDVEVFTPAADPDGVGRLALVGTRNISGYYPHGHRITNDTLVEPNETLKPVLSNPTGNAALAWPSTALLSIVNDD